MLEYDIIHFFAHKIYNVSVNMNIIYFTTCQENNDYNEYLKAWPYPINSSSQMIHNRLVRSLSLYHHVDVISLRPFSKQDCLVKNLLKGERVTNRIHWHYLSVRRGKIGRFSFIWAQVEKILHNVDKNSIIISDTINTNVFALATYAAKRKHMPIIGVCTNSPSNITGTNRSYALNVLKLAKHLDGTIALTPALNDLYNEKNKPSIIVEGLVEDYLPLPGDNKYGKYLFYSGSLYEKYGIYNLIQAFNELELPDYKLLICGHHEGKTFLEAIRRKKNIRYLGALSNQECIQLQQNAVANINPRPFNEDLDRFTVPSKMFEYLNSSRPSISTKSSRLMKVFQEDAIWMKTGSVEDIKEAIHTLLALSDEEKDYLGKKAHDRAQMYYSLSNVGLKLDDFLKTFFRKN